MIECTELFVGSEWSCAHVMNDNTVRINIQKDRKVFCVYMNVDKLYPFLNRIRREQAKKAASK